MSRTLPALTLVLLVAACSQGKQAQNPTSPTAPTGTTSPPAAPSNGLHFTASPMAIGDIQTITALGAMAPWGHTLPTDHVYFVHAEGASSNYPPVPVYAPGSGTIEWTTNGRVDVRVDTIFSYWIGPLALAEGVTPGAHVDAGQLLGYHSTFPAFDFAVLRSTLQLPFANMARYGRDTLTSDGPMQYFDEPIRSALEAKVRRTGSDKEGRLNYDVPGTLSGNWYAADLPVSESGRGGEIYYGVRKLSFARDVFSPERPRVSIGGLGLTGLFAVPVDAPEFAAVTPASGLVVFRLLTVGAPQTPPTTTQAGWLLVQLIDPLQLRIEAVPLPSLVSMDASEPPPATFTSRAELYLR